VSFRVEVKTKAGAWVRCARLVGVHWSSPIGDSVFETEGQAFAWASRALAKGTYRVVRESALLAERRST
jgi:hypothetical protein